ncbi:hypothetical protein, partial [Streptomyces zaomyceticus]|uniref:hypothetical protein n=1 Tax=Streptomyces zaomyceticus TaxID=68286 RepID=UPI0036CB6C73
MTYIPPDVAYVFFVVLGDFPLQADPEDSFAVMGVYDVALVGLEGVRGALVDVRGVVGDALPESVAGAFVGVVDWFTG